METVLIVSVLKYSANNNKTFLLKNTAIETKHRTLRELYNEAIVDRADKMDRKQKHGE